MQECKGHEFIAMYPTEGILKKGIMIVSTQ